MENHPLKILAIDDNQDNLTSVKALIREAFPQALVLTATEAGQGIELAQAEDPEVILLDVVMPGMDGFEACRQLKANPLTRYIPVVFLTAIKGDKDARIRALEVGAEAFLSKPIDEIELTAQIRAMQKIKAASTRERAEKEDLTELVAARTRELDLAHTAALNLLEDLRKENEARQESEKSLREHEQMLSAIVESSQDWIWAIDHNRRHTFSNRAVESILGYSPAEFQGLGLDLVHPDDKRLVEAEWPGSVEERRGWRNKVLRWRAKDGTYRYLESTAVPILDPRGELLGFRGVDRDITERKQAAEDLQRKQAMLAQTEALAHVGSWEWEVATDTVIWSDELFRIFRRDPDLGAPSFAEHSSLYPPEDFRRLNEAVEAAIREGTPYEIELHALCLDGATRTCLAHGQAEKRDGRVVRLSGFIQDITARKRAEDALRRYEMAVEQSSDGIAIADVAGTLTFVNTAWARMHGYETIELVGQPLSICHTQEQMENDVGSFTDAVRKEGTCLGEIGHRRKDGTTFPTWMTGTIMTDHQGKSVGMVGIVRDITERKRVEADLRASQQLAESIIDSIPGTFYMLDEAGKYVRWSAYQRDEIVGKPDDQIAGFPAIETIHPDDRALVQARIANVLRSGVVEIVEGRVLLRGGPKFQWLLMTGRRLVVAGHPYLVGIGIDITERKEADASLKEWLDELRRWQVVTLGREDRVQELKREVNEACRRLGEPARYPSQEAGAVDSGEERP